MISQADGRREACRPEHAPDECGPDLWRVDRVHTVKDIALVIRVVTGAMSAAGHSANEVYGMRLALEEAIVNAHKHGHRGRMGQANHGPQLREWGRRDGGGRG